MSTFDQLIEAGAALQHVDWDNSPEPFRRIMAAGRAALAERLSSMGNDTVHRQEADVALFTKLGDLDALDRQLDELIASMRDELALLTSQELAKITDETSGGVLAITYRSMAAETLRSRLG